MRHGSGTLFGYRAGYAFSLWNGDSAVLYHGRSQSKIKCIREKWQQHVLRPLGFFNNERNHSIGLACPLNQRIGLVLEIQVFFFLITCSFSWFFAFCTWYSKDCTVISLCISTCCDLPILLLIPVCYTTVLYPYHLDFSVSLIKLETRKIVAFCLT